MAARRHWTRRWWDEYASNYELTTSQAVIRELERGEYGARTDAVDLVVSLPRLDAESDDIDNIIDVYLDNQLMPKDRLGDALHLALASVHKCDFLLTWNCAHIANPNKFDHIHTINTRLGLKVPKLVTPMQLIEED